MKAILMRATGEQVEVNVPPPAPPTVTYPHPNDRMRLEVFDLVYEHGVGLKHLNIKHMAVYRERDPHSLAGLAPYTDTEEYLGWE